MKGENTDENTIRAPIVGTFYDGSKPCLVIPYSQTGSGKPYVEVGSIVEPETIVCVMEAMMIPNKIRAEVHGTIEKVLINLNIL